MKLRHLTVLAFFILSLVLVAAVPNPLQGAAYAQADPGGGSVSSDDSSWDSGDSDDDSSGDDEDDSADDADESSGSGGVDSQDEAPVGSPAAGKPQTVDENGNIKKCADVPEARGGVLLGIIMPCLTYTIEKGTMRFSQAMVDWLRPLLYTFLTLVVVLFGVRMLQQEPNLEKQGFMLLVKVALVVMILDNIPTYFVPAVYGVMSESQSVVLSTLDSSSLTSLTCKADEFGDANTPRIWATMDCLMGKLFGFTAGNATGPSGEKTPNMLLATSMFGLMTGFIFGGPWGVVIFFGMLGVLVSMFLLVIRSAMAFLMGYLIACVMLILCPLLMPLIFMRSTQNYFEAISKNLLAAFVMPVIVSAYAVFALLLYDKMLFAPDSILQKLFRYEEIKDALENPRKVCDFQVTGDRTKVLVDESTPNAPTQPELALNKIMKPNSTLLNKSMPQLSAGNDLCAKALVNSFNIKSVKSADFKKGKGTYEKMFYELMQLLILGYLIYLGMASMETITLQLTGVGTSSQGFQKLPGEKGIGSAVENMKQRMMDARTPEGKTETGAEFLKRVPLDARDSIRSFFNDLSKRK